MYVRKSLFDKYPNDTYKKEVVSKVEDELGHFVTKVSFVESEPPEFELIPAEVFDTESLRQSGNLAEVQKVKFSTGMDIDMLDRAQDSMLRSMRSLELSVNEPGTEPSPEPGLEPKSKPGSELEPNPE